MKARVVERDEMMASLKARVNHIKEENMGF